MKKIFICLLLLSPFLSFAQSKSIERTGDVLQYMLPTAAGISTLIYKDGTKPTLQFAKAFSITMLTTYALKFTIDKKRPSGGDRAFPSGHTAAAFCGAAFIHKRYGTELGIPSYILAGFVGWSRVDANKHDWMDVGFGALLGAASGYFNAKKIKLNTMELGMEVQGNHVSLNLIF